MAFMETESWSWNSSFLWRRSPGSLLPLFATHRDSSRLRLMSSVPPIFQCSPFRLKERHYLFANAFAINELRTPYSLMFSATSKARPENAAVLTE